MANWFRDYVFRPLGGDRGSPARAAVNILVTFALLGLWHGANWTFVAWGLYHGGMLVAYRHALRRRWVRRRPPRRRRWASLPLGRVVIPLAIVVSSVSFRSRTLGEAYTIFGRIAALTPGMTVSGAWPVLLVGLYALHWAFYLRYREGVLVRAAWPARLAWIGGALLLVTLGAGAGEPFYYFQF
jgi:alginate O-acetyltransferase complex protein AlgI